MAYVYRHIRLDKNLPFYIGIGTDKNYKRANIRKGRNKLWERIASKTEINVEVFIDGITWGLACEKEKEFIKLYGRINNKTGILSNLTDGGEGIIGQVISDKMKQAIKDRNSRPIAQYDMDGKFIRSFKSLTEAGLLLGAKLSPISAAVNGYKGAITAYGFVWKKFYENIENIEFDRKKYEDAVFGKKKINVYKKNGKFYKTFSSIGSAAIELGIAHERISAILSGKHHQTKGFLFKYFYDTLDIVPPLLHRDQSGNRNFMYGKIGINKGKIGSLSHLKKSVNQYDLTGGFIKNHECIIDASKETGAGQSAITACCKGKLKTSGNFIWRYEPNK